MRVTRTYLPSGATSMARIIAGAPNFLTVPFATSTSASWPVACHSSSCSSYGVVIRLGNVRTRFLSVSIASLTDGPVGAAAGCGIGARPSGTSTVAICLPSFVKSNVVTSVARTGLLRHLARHAARGVGDPDVRCVFAVHVEGDRLAVGRPRGVRDARTGRQLDQLLAAIGRRDDLDADVVAHRQRPRAVRLVVDEQAAQLVERLGERLHHDRAVTDFVDEELAVGADVGQRDVEIPRREHRVGQLPRRRLIRLLLEDVVG